MLLPGALSLWRRWPLGSVSLRVEYGAWERPHYAYGVYHAAIQAKQLGLPGVTVFEAGVAGGNGLLALERCAAEIAGAVGIEVDVFGFDGGAGMPEPLDYRDLPYVWDQGFYEMDEGLLRSKLSSAKLVIGDVGKTLPSAIAEMRFPVGFGSFDLDYYSSTKNAFAVFDKDQATRLPRVYCYFDDIVYPERAMYCDWTGELCAIREFNEEHSHQKIAPIAHLAHTRRLREFWCVQMYGHHDFKHPLYERNLTADDESARQLRL